ncbi:MAG: putative toxin-antitoxin system toxin component, PIN family [Thermoleophilia bacterium]|nr:putative toxin-antitoxin system toxin component, PIN family [Thermoleophilia bacterium]
MRIRAVIDTNVYLSAILFGGKPGEVFLFAKNEVFDLCVSTAILAELAAKLTDKFHWPAGKVRYVIKEIGETAAIVRPKKRIEAVPGDESDNRILECAVESKAEYIVSGDQRHLLPLKEYEGIKIVSPAQFLKRIKKP